MKMIIVARGNQLFFLRFRSKGVLELMNSELEET